MLRTGGWRLAGLAAMLGTAGMPCAATESGEPLRQFLEETRAIAASFEQSVTSAEGELLTTGHGRMSLQRPDRLRWNHESPEPLELVADGLNFWSYDPFLAQATVMPLAEATRQTPLAVLIGQQTWEESFRVVETAHRDGVDWMALRPRTGEEQAGDIQIGLKAGVLRELRFANQFGQIVHIRLAQIEINPPLDDDHFDFHPPPGTDILGTPAR